MSLRRILWEVRRETSPISAQSSVDTDVLLVAAANDTAPSPRGGEGWGKNAPGEHYKGRRPYEETERFRQQYLLTAVTSNIT